jgi:hypothetical protein
VSPFVIVDLVLLVIISLGALISARYFIEAVRDRERLNTLMAATCFFLFARRGGGAVLVEVAVRYEPESTRLEKAHQKKSHDPAPFLARFSSATQRQVRGG